VDHVCSVTEHPPLPVPGDEVLFVGQCHGVPVRATVLAVDFADPEDLNVWRWRTDPTTGRPVPVLDRDGAPVMVDWPNPNITMRDEHGHEQITRQIRYRGSPGWIWPLYLPDVGARMSDQEFFDLVRAFEGSWQPKAPWRRTGDA